ncbi:MarR family transcriptional regulator [Hymenobacter lutimineralis]|uniref:MarR family transcriptional regulator n=1 Tax=Hymenobacter lutimineralis TaxID=2606448 RepID=A0A5D6UTH6_9BACT|nr:MULTISPECIES: MarR family transcriptional regulator [Hymenobacter]QIX62632.1 MarR family transcriptional regulator [Hymenobacter sp. BT18]TYZ06417.1 MarR family transcriptional regulator [Hymenobacter lutimineralis]
MRIEDEIKQPNFQSEYQKAYINLVYTAGWLQLRQAAAFKEFNLTLPQYNVLRILRGQHPRPATVNLLIERMLDKTSNASRIVDKLEAKQLVTRRVCPSNRRAVDICITEAGLALLETMQPMVEQQAHGLRQLSDQEVEQLNYLLDKLRD